MTLFYSFFETRNLQSNLTFSLYFQLTSSDMQLVFWNIWNQKVISSSFSFVLSPFFITFHMWISPQMQSIMNWFRFEEVVMSLTVNAGEITDFLLKGAKKYKDSSWLVQQLQKLRARESWFAKINNLRLILFQHYWSDSSFIRYSLN